MNESSHHILHTYMTPEAEPQLDWDLFHPGGCGEGEDQGCWVQHELEQVGPEGYETPGMYRVLAFAEQGYMGEWDVGVQETGGPEDWWEAGKPDSVKQPYDQEPLPLLKAADE